MDFGFPTLLVDINTLGNQLLNLLVKKKLLVNQITKKCGSDGLMDAGLYMLLFPDKKLVKVIIS